MIMAQHNKNASIKTNIDCFLNRDKLSNFFKAEVITSHINHWKFKLLKFE